jgi:hypothetical protein
LLLVAWAVSLRWHILFAGDEYGLFIEADYCSGITNGRFYFATGVAPWQGFGSDLGWAVLPADGLFGLVLPSFTQVPAEGWGRPDRWYVMPLWLPFLPLVFATGLLWRRYPRRFREGRCPHCRYNLTGNVSGVCPECGEKV